MTKREREEYVSISEAASRYGVPVRTIWSWIMRDQLASYKFPRHRHTYVKPDELNALLRREYKTGRPGKWRNITTPEV